MIRFGRTLRGAQAAWTWASFAGCVAVVGLCAIFSGWPVSASPLAAEPTSRPPGEEPAVPGVSGAEPARADGASTPPGAGVADNPLRPAGAELDIHAPISAKVFRYARRFVERRDQDGDGQLLPSDQWPEDQLAPLAADLDGDGMLTVEEIAQAIANYGRDHAIRVAAPPYGDSPFPPLLTPTTPSEEAIAAESSAETGADPALETPSNGAAEDATQLAPRRDRRFAARLPAGLPDWFDDRDGDGDGQLTVREFAPAGTATRLGQFADYDANHDGVVTADECLRAIKRPSSGTEPP